MNVFSDSDHSFVRIRDDRLPGCEWLLQLPEYGYAGVTLGGVSWEEVEAGRRLRYTWRPSDDLRATAGVFYEGEIRASEDDVSFRVRRANLSSADWSSSQGSLFCLRSGAAAPFHDLDGVRTYALKGGMFQSVCQLVNARFAGHRMCRFPVRSAPGEEAADACERLMAKISRDGRWVLGIATDRCGCLSCNHQPAVSCIHSNPNWGVVRPGGSAEARGKVYLLNSSIEMLRARYEADFPG
ncbi:MAG: hypothetical protein HYU36_22660 [Planctomycetes bacterium]|nr:hypothetical protein [Planctomycetota bacterium]